MVGIVYSLCALPWASAKEEKTIDQSGEFVLFSFRWRVCAVAAFLVNVSSCRCFFVEANLVKAIIYSLK
jgi:hypothetical protein